MSPYIFPEQSTRRPRRAANSVAAKFAGSKSARRRRTDVMGHPTQVNPEWRKLRSMSSSHFLFCNVPVEQEKVTMERRTDVRGYAQVKPEGIRNSLSKRIRCTQYSIEAEGIRPKIFRFPVLVVKASAGRLESGGSIR